MQQPDVAQLPAQSLADQVEMYARVYNPLLESPLQVGRVQLQPIVGPLPVTPVEPLLSALLPVQR